jgi:hypothetical protein
MENRVFNSILLTLVIFGSMFANINIVASMIPEHANNGNSFIENVFEKKAVSSGQTTATEFHELDATAILSLYRYLHEQAKANDFTFLRTTFSAGLVLQSDNTLIVIGHGILYSENRYYIADYSMSSIQELATNYEKVALLSCYSSNIALTTAQQLTYNKEIDLLTALEDLFSFLQWEKTTTFEPQKNILLNKNTTVPDFQIGDNQPRNGFDPGGGNGWSVENPPPMFNIKRQAYSYYEGHLYFNLWTDSGIIALSTYMLNHKWRLVKFTFKGNFIAKTNSNPNTYELSYQTITFDSYIHTEGDMKDYWRIQNIEINGVLQKKWGRQVKYDPKVDDIVDGMSTSGLSKDACLGLIGGASIALATSLVTIGAIIIKAAFGIAAGTISAEISAALVGALGCCTVALGLAIFITVIIVGIVLFVNCD